MEWYPAKSLLPVSRMQSPQFLTVITGTDQVHSVEFPKQLYLMIVHMLPVAGKSRHCDHFFPLFYGAMITPVPPWVMTIRHSRSFPMKPSLSRNLQYS